MTDPIQVLQDYGQQVDAVDRPITHEEIRGRVAQLVPESDSSRVPPWFAAIAVATLLILVLGGVTLLTGRSDTAIEPAVSSHQTLSVEVSGVSDHDGDDLAGVLYEGSDLSDLDRDAVGGFWSVVMTDNYTVTEVLREPGTVGEGRFPYVSSEALIVKPGTYTLVLWVDTSLGEVSRWVPLNTDGRGLFACQSVFEVGDDLETSVSISPSFYPNGWNTNCTTGATVPGTNRDAPVNPDA